MTIFTQAELGWEHRVQGRYRCQRLNGRCRILRMDAMNRRDLMVALSSFAALAAVAAEGTGTTGAGNLPENDGCAPKPRPGRKAIRCWRRRGRFRFEDLPVVKTANGETRAVTPWSAQGRQAVEMHETRLLPGHMPHPPHQHKHSEFILVREGQMEFENVAKPDNVVGPVG